MRRNGIDRFHDHFRDVDSTRDHDLDSGFYTGHTTPGAVGPTSSSTHDTFNDTLPSSAYKGSMYSGDGEYGMGSDFCSTPDSFFPSGSSHYLDVGLLNPDSESMGFPDSTCYSPEFFPWLSLDANSLEPDPVGSFYSPYPSVISELLEHDATESPGNYARPAFSKEYKSSRTGSDLAHSDYTPSVRTKTEDTEVCRSCGRRFQRPSDLRRHERLHEDPIHPCRMPDCGRAFTRTDKLRDHHRQAHGVDVLAEDASPSEKPTLQCLICRITFDRPVELNRHNNRKHNLRFKCDMCNKAFGLQSDLQRHQVTTHRLQASQFRCKVHSCNFESPRKDNLLRHVKSKHGKEAFQVAKGRSETI